MSKVELLMSLSPSTSRRTRNAIKNTCRILGSSLQTKIRKWLHSCRKEDVGHIHSVLNWLL